MKNRESCLNMSSLNQRSNSKDVPEVSDSETWGVSLIFCLFASRGRRVERVVLTVSECSEKKLNVVFFINRLSWF